LFELTADGSFFGNTGMGNNLIKVTTSDGRITATTTVGETTAGMGSADYEVTGATLTFSNLGSNPNIFLPLKNAADLLEGKFYKKANASTPKLGVQPQAAIYGDNDTAAWPLSVTASVTDGGELSYQWYSNTTTDTDNGTLIDGATQVEYTPPITTTGEVYYYVVVTNTNNAAIGNTTMTTTSVAAKVEKKAGDVIHAEKPEINTHPQNATYAVGGEVAPVVTPLSVTASVTDGGSLSYQWFSNTTNSTSGGTLITGATQTTYTPPITRTAYYYVIVTNTNTSVTGTQVRATTSNIATIEVTAGGGDEGPVGPGPVDPGPLPPLDPGPSGSSES
jgi:hypothetical protein